MKTSISLRACALSIAASTVAGETVKLEIPNAPPAGSQTLDGSYQGYSMEVASFTDLAGNLSHPNQLSYKMLSNLKAMTGSAPPIRVGGTTANHATYIPTQKEAYIPYYATPGADQPANLTIGPAYLESFHTFPQGTEYIMGLTFDLGAAGENKSVVLAQALKDSLGDSLYALEVGNEFDTYPVNRPSPYPLTSYVSEWLNRTAAIEKRVFPNTEDKKLFQAGVFTSYKATANSNWTAQETIDLGIDSTGMARTFAVHQYFGAACNVVKPTLAGSIMNRTLLATQMVYHKEASQYSVEKGLPYVLGETNSIACQGLAGVSDTFGSALWSIDYSLWAASLNVSKIYWQMGTGYRYSPWQAVKNGTTEAGPRPMYYGNMAVSTALGGADKQVVAIVNTTSLAGYAIYAAPCSGKSAQLESVVLVNMDLYNSTAVPATNRTSVDFEIPKSMKQSGSAQVRRLTAAGAEVKDGVTFAGRTVALDGNITGREAVEKVKGNTVTVKASEAVVISFGR